MTSIPIFETEQELFAHFDRRGPVRAAKAKAAMVRFWMWCAEHSSIGQAKRLVVCKSCGFVKNGERFAECSADQFATAEQFSIVQVTCPDCRGIII